MAPLGAARCSSSKVSTALVKEMRQLTSAPMKKCVDALKATDGDIEAAVAWLRKAGLASAKKLSDRGSNEGVVAVAQDAGRLAVVEINSETDFVARNEMFQALTQGVVQSALAVEPADGVQQLVHDLDPALLLQAGLRDAPAPTSVGEAIGVAASRLGENLVLRRAALLTLPSPGLLVSYVHNTYVPGMGRTAAALSLLSDSSDVDALRKLGGEIAMHIVAAAPTALSKEAVDAAAVEAEVDILRAQAESSGKGKAVIDKMVLGRLNKFYQQVVLLEQQFVVDESAGSVRKVLDAASKRLGAEVTLGAFVRYHVGGSQ